MDMKIYTLEGLQEEAAEFVGFMPIRERISAAFCNPGFVMNTIALLRENPDPTDDEIRPIWQETSADAPAMKDAAGHPEFFWIREEK